MPRSDDLQHAWTSFRRPGNLLALAAAAVTIIAFGLLSAAGDRSTCDGPCGAVPQARDGAVVSDRFWFFHQDLERHGSITVRMTSMTGTISYPPPDHDEIVPGLVPWAKAGIIIKDGVQPGSPYAALMMTGHHGVRFQYDYRHDVAGRAGNVSDQEPRWLRLTRTGDTITGSESLDGRHWNTVGRATLDDLPDTVQVGLFATSPGDLTLRRTGLGGAVEETRFTQAIGVFDDVAVTGGSGPWVSEPVGEMNHTEWEKTHRASGAEVANGVITVSGTGDIAPHSEEQVRVVEDTLTGVPAALVILIVAAALFGARGTREVLPPSATLRRVATLWAGTFITALVTIGVVVPVGIAALEGNGVAVQPVPMAVAVRVVVGTAVALASCSAFAFGLGAWLRRGWLAALLAFLAVVMPYVMTSFPLLPDEMARWMLRLTPAAGFAIRQTVTAYPQVIAHYAPSTGYFPLSGWAGLSVLTTYTLFALLPGLWRDQQATPRSR